jgi:hypothetical protein
MADAYELEFYAEDDGAKPVLAWIKNDLTPACSASSATPTVRSSSSY